MPTNGAEAWSSFFADLAEGQEVRKDSVERRGVAVVTTSGAFVTLMFGLVALLTDSEGFALPHQSRGPIGLSVGLLTVAALLGLLTNLPRKYQNVDDAALLPSLDTYLAKEPSAAHTDIAHTHFRIYAAATKVNETKARLLVGGMLCQLLGLASVALAVREILVHG